MAKVRAGGLRFGAAATAPRPDGGRARLGMLGTSMKSPPQRSAPAEPRPAAAGHAAAVRGRIAWFLLVGGCSAAVHWSVVVALVRHAGWPPLLANVLGWLVAYCVSFVGHHRLSFRGHGASLWTSARRYFAISAAGFAVNQLTFALLLRQGGWRFDIVLALVLAGVAVLTYLLGRHWAFLRSDAPPP